MKQKFPDVIYIHRNTESIHESDHYLAVNEEPSGAVDVGESKVLGVYRLQGFIEAKNQTTVGKLSPNLSRKRKA